MTRDLGQFDLIVVGGGVNGAGIARDAAGRGLSVLLCEKDDLAQGTSSRSGKLVHGGLALSRILRVSPCPRGADRARGSASRRAAHHLADAVRPASQPGATSGLDGPGGPVSLRSLGRAQDPAADAKPRPVQGARGRAHAQEFQPRLRIFGLLGGRRATGRPERFGRPQARRHGVDEDAAHIGAARGRHMARRFAKRERRGHARRRPERFLSTPRAPGSRMFCIGRAATPRAASGSSRAAILSRANSGAAIRPICFRTATSA